MPPRFGRVVGGLAIGLVLAGGLELGRNQFNGTNSTAVAASRFASEWQRLDEVALPSVTPIRVVRGRLSNSLIDLLAHSSIGPAKSSVTPLEVFAFIREGNTTTVQYILPGRIQAMQGTWCWLHRNNGGGLLRSCRDVGDERPPQSTQPARYLFYRGEQLTTAARPRFVTTWNYVASLLALEPELYTADAAEHWPDRLREFYPGMHLTEIVETETPERVMDIFRNYQPAAGCSQDTIPASVANEYADYCHQLGRLGCFLRLRVRIMGNQFSRPAYSYVGELMAVTEADRLREAGIDVHRFLLGLVLEYDERRLESIGAYRLGRSIADVAPELARPLRQWIEDSTLDPYNRLRAAQVLFYLQREQGATVHDSREALLSLDHGTAVAAWLANAGY